MRKERVFFPEGKFVRTAVDVAVLKNEKEVLLGRRLVKAGYGTWGFPGGHLRDDERIRECARREIVEEIGNNIEIKITNEILSVRENRIPPFFISHLTVILKGIYIRGEQKLMEPDRCSEWKFIDLDDLQNHPLFSGVEETLKNLRDGKVLVVSDWKNPKRT